MLGAGGYLGAAWSVGALSAMRDVLGWELGEADLVVGTSAGAVLAALLRAGKSVRELCGERAAFDLAEQPCWPGAPSFGVGSKPLAWRAVCPPWSVSPFAVCAALLPRGRGSLASVGSLVGRARPGPRWPANTWTVAMNYDTGSRTVFGRPEGPRSSLARAVMASCAVPVWYAPVRVRGVPYVDGAVCSPCNADLLAGEALDEVYVLAPMASRHLDRPAGALARLERLWRRVVTRRTLREVARLQEGGARVHLLTPNAEDLELMGANMMDGTRRHDVLQLARETVSRALRSARRRLAAA